MINKSFDRFSTKVTKLTGSTGGFVSAFVLILLWALAGPFFHWSEMHSMLINTITTVITFLMVFLIQYSQNKETLILKIKLDELLASQKGAQNRLIDLDDLSDKDLEEILKERKEILAKSKFSNTDKTISLK